MRRNQLGLAAAFLTGDRVLSNGLLRGHDGGRAFHVLVVALICALVAAGPPVSAAPASAASRASNLSQLISGEPDPEALDLDKALRALLTENRSEAIAGFTNVAKRSDRSSLAWWGIAASVLPGRDFGSNRAALRMGARAISRAKALGAPPGSVLYDLIAAIGKRYDPETFGLAADVAPYIAAIAHISEKYRNNSLALEICAQALLSVPEASPAELQNILSRLIVLRAQPDDRALAFYQVLVADRLGTARTVLNAANSIDALPLAASEGRVAFAAALPYIAVGDYSRASAASRRAFELDQQLAQHVGQPVDRISESPLHLEVWYAAAALAARHDFNPPDSELARRALPWYPAAVAYTTGDFALASKVADIYGEEAVKLHAPPEFQYITALSYVENGRVQSAETLMQVFRSGRESDSLRSATVASALEARIRDRGGRVDEARAIYSRLIPEVDRQSVESLAWWLLPVRIWLAELELRAGHTEVALSIAVAGETRFPGDVRYANLVKRIHVKNPGLAGR